MSQTESDCNSNATILKTITREDIQTLADRLFSLGVTSVTTISDKDQSNLVMASRIMRRLLATYERNTGRELSALFLCEVP